MSSGIPSQEVFPGCQTSAPDSDGALYKSIPLPPRPSLKRQTSSQAFRALLQISQSWRRKCSPLSPSDRERRVEFFQAFAAAVAINIVFVVLLLFVAVDRASFTEDFSSVTVVDIHEETDSANAEDKSPSAPTAAVSPSIPQFPDHKPAAPLPSVALTVSSSTWEVATRPGEDMGAFLGQSVSFEALAESENQRREEIREFVESEGTQTPLWADRGLGESGVSAGVLGKVFRSELIGDGSNTVVYLDVSGSMRLGSEDVEAYMKTHFSGAQVRHIRGCSLKRLMDPFPSALLSESERNTRSEYYFVCDLQDGENSRVISALQRFLNSGPIPRHLHFVSFDRTPERHLSGLLTNKGCSWVMARGLKEEPAP